MDEKAEQIEYSRLGKKVSINKSYYSKEKDERNSYVKNSF